MRLITASDLMNPEVLTVREDMRVHELAAFLIDNSITGAPVEDASGQLVGVVSVVDIAEVAAGFEDDEPWDDDPDDGGEDDPDADLDDDPEGEDLDDGSDLPDFYVRSWAQGLSDVEVGELDLCDEDELTVGDIMNPEILSVDQGAPVSEVASIMLRAHVHRLLVLDEDRPVGIVTTSDLLGLLVDEEES